MSNDEFRICEFCGCRTNAHLRSCCADGRLVDLRAEGITPDESSRKRVVELQDGSPCRLHSWDAWHSTSDQHGLLSPAADGAIYAYSRECQIAGCHAVEYVEELVPKGRRVIDHGGQRFPQITQR